jgi:uroporphyrinogen decarboxylase
MSLPKNDRLIRTIKKEPVDATPIWIMRQAGRYLPEYRATRARAGSFMTLCKTPELACEVTLQPLARFDLDASIIFSDILTIPDAMGLGLNVIESKGPVFSKPLRSAHDIHQLQVPDAEQLSYVYDAIRLVQHELAGKVPLIGFCGSPWTLAAYAVEGESKPGFPTLLKMRDEEPLLLHKLLDVLADSVALHLNHQIAAGANVVMLFDTWGGMLDRQNYLEFSIYYIKQVLSQLDRYNNYTKCMVPVILFTKGGSRWLDIISDTGCDVVGLDWEINLATARQQVGTRVALQGNMHPGLLLSDPESIQKEVQAILGAYGNGSGHIFNLGHGITPDVPPEHVKILVDAVHEMSQAFHRA